MGGGANNKAVHTWARKFNMTTGSLVQDWVDEEDGEEDFQREKQLEEDERTEMEEAEQEFADGSAEEDNERRRLDLGWEDQAEVLELGERVAKAQKVLSDLPPLEWPDPDREKLVAMGEELKRSAEGYFLKHLREEVGGFEAAVEEERKGAPEKARLQHGWEAQADVLAFAERVARAQKVLSDLPPLEEPDPDREKLVARGEELNRAAEGYVISRLQEEVGPFEAAVEEERKGAPEKARLQHDWEAQAEALTFGDKLQQALQLLKSLPPLPDRAEGRGALVLQGEALEKAVANYSLKRLKSEVPGFLEAVAKEDAETSEILRKAAEVNRLFNELVEMLDAVDNLESVLPDEKKPLRGLREAGKSAAELVDLGRIRKIHEDCAEIVELLFNDPAVIQLRLEALVNGKKPDKLISEAWEMFQSAGGKRPDLGFGKPAYNKVISLSFTPPAVYKILAQSTCIAHAKVRHTFAGILKADHVETDHVSMVAIFDDDSELRKAVQGVSTNPRNWFRLRNGFHRCDVGNFRVYGGISGDTVALQTCFPLDGGGPQYFKDDVTKALKSAKGNLADFKRLVKGEITAEELEKERNGDK